MENQEISKTDFEHISHSENDAIKPRRALLHFAVFAACLAVPIGLVPYLAAQRTTNALNRRINDSFITINRIQQDLNSLKLDHALRRDELTKLKGLITQMKQEAHATNVEFKKDLRRLQVTAETLGSIQAAANDAFRSDFRRALEDAR